MLKQKLFPLSLLIMSIFFLSSCEAIEGIFKAGMWTMLLIIVAVVALIIWLVGKARK